MAVGRVFTFRCSSWELIEGQLSLWLSILWRSQHPLVGVDIWGEGLCFVLVGKVWCLASIVPSSSTACAFLFFFWNRLDHWLVHFSPAITKYGRLLLAQLEGRESTAAVIIHTRSKLWAAYISFLSQRDTEIIKVLLIEHDLWLIEWREILVDSLWDLVTLDVGWKRSQGGVSPESGLGLKFGHILLLLMLQVLEVSICLSELWINCLL